MHDDRGAGDLLLDRFDDVEVEGLLALELVGAVAGADGGGEGVAAGPLDEFDGLLGIGEAGVAFVDLDVLLDAAELAELGLDADALGVGAVDHPLGDGDVLLEGVVGGVDHHRAVEAGIDAIVAGLLVAVVEVDGVDRLGEDIVGGADEGLEHPLVGVFARSLGELDDEGGLGGHAAAEEAEDLLEIIHIVGPDGEFAVGHLEEFGGGDDHGGYPTGFPVAWQGGAASGSLNSPMSSPQATPLRLGAYST